MLDKLEATVIIPCYNAARTIGATLESVTNQDFHNYEIVIVDDGSTDGTSEILSTCTNKQVRIERIKHSGVSCARNVGLALAKGDIVAFLDADDLWFNYTLGAQVSFLLSQYHVDLVFGDCYFSEHGLLSTHPLSDAVPQPSRPSLLDLVASRPIPLSTVAARRSLLSRIGGFDESLESCEDYDLWYRLLTTGATFAALRQVLAIISIQINGLSADLNRYKRSMSHVLSKLLQFPGLDSTVRARAETELSGLPFVTFPNHEAHGRTNKTTGGS